MEEHLATLTQQHVIRLIKVDSQRSDLTHQVTIAADVIHIYVGVVCCNLMWGKSIVMQKSFYRVELFIPYFQLVHSFEIFRS